ncbi:MAG TPA: hypothetical protein VGD56_17790 [Gemmatirosa sp.]
MLDVRKLAAIDIALLGPRLILAEFGTGVVGALALGSFAAVRSQSTPGRLLAAYLVTLGVNYVPLLVYALALRAPGRAHAVIGAELAADRRGAMRRYRRGSLLLLMPLVVPLLAVVQDRRRRTRPARAAGAAGDERP